MSSYYRKKNPQQHHHQPLQLHGRGKMREGKYSRGVEEENVSQTQTNLPCVMDGNRFDPASATLI